MRGGERMKTFAELAKDKGIPLPEQTEKYNHHHDARGRFSTADAAAFVSLPKPGNRSMPKEMKEHQAGGGGGGSAAAAQETKHETPKQTDHQTAKEYFGAAKGNDTKEVNVLRQKLTESSGQEISQERAKNIHEAVKYYSDDGYAAVRYAQQNPSDTILVRGRETAKHVEDFIELSPKWEKPVYRGMKMDKKGYDSFMSQIEAGKILDMNGTSSWTSSEKMAKSYAVSNDKKKSNKVVLEMDKTNHGTSIKHMAKWANEDEIVISQKAKMKVVSVTVKSQITHIKLKEVAE
jgi:hypothetical protein